MFSFEIIINTLVTAIGFLFIFFFTIRSFRKKAFKQIKKEYPHIDREQLFLFQEISPKNLPTWKNFLKKKEIKFYYIHICENKLEIFDINKSGEMNLTEYNRNNTLISIIKNNDLFPAFNSFISINKEGKRLVLGSSTLRKKTIKSIINKLEQIFPNELINFEDENIEKKSLRTRIFLYSSLLMAAGVLTYAAVYTPTNNTPHTLALLSDNSVLVTSDSKIVHLDQNGEHINTILTKNINIEGGVAGIKEDKYGNLLIGDYKKKTIKLCDKNDWICNEHISLNPDTKLVCKSYLFDIDIRNSRLFVTDINRHRILEFDNNGNLTKTHFNSKEMCFPNQIAIYDEGLAITNTNHSKIQVFDVDNFTGPKLVKEFLTVEVGRTSVNCPEPDIKMLDKCPDMEKGIKNYPQPFEFAGSGRIWPTNVIKDSKGNWWVINYNNKFMISDLIKFDNDGKNPEAIISEKNKYPMNVIARKNDVLVLTLGKLEIMRFDFEGNYIGDFDTSFLKNEFLDISSEKSRYELLIYILILTIILLLVLSCIISLMLLPVERLKYIKD